MLGIGVGLLRWQHLGRGTRCDYKHSLTTAPARQQRWRAQPLANELNRCRSAPSPASLEAALHPIPRTSTATARPLPTCAPSGLSFQAINSLVTAAVWAAKYTTSPFRLRAGMALGPRRGRMTGSRSSNRSTRLSSVTLGTVRFRLQPMTALYWHSPGGHETRISVPRGTSSVNNSGLAHQLGLGDALPAVGGPRGWLISNPHALPPMRTTGSGWDCSSLKARKIFHSLPGKLGSYSRCRT